MSHHGIAAIAMTSMLAGCAHQYASGRLADTGPDSGEGVCAQSTEQLGRASVGIRSCAQWRSFAAGAASPTIAATLSCEDNFILAIPVNWMVEVFDSRGRLLARSDGVTDSSATLSGMETAVTVLPEEFVPTTYVIRYTFMPEGSIIAEHAIALSQ